MKLMFLSALHALVVMHVLSGAAQAAGETGAVPPSSSPAPAEAQLHILSNAQYRAIFCGEEGTESGPGYAKALVADLRRLESKPRSTREAMAYLRLRACTRHAGPVNR